MMALDREVQYLLNKAKFTKPRPRPKDKNGNRTEPPVNASAGDQGEKVIPPAGQTEEAKPILEPDKEKTGELRNVFGDGHFISLGASKLASIMNCLWPSVVKST